MDLKTRIEEFVKAADEITAEYWRRAGYVSSNAPTHRAKFSEKWAKIVTVENPLKGLSHEGSVFAFIALQDGQTKTLGTLKAGDIHKPASFNAPAKHARANVFNDDFRKAITPNGIVYLRG